MCFFNKPLVDSERKLKYNLNHSWHKLNKKNNNNNIAFIDISLPTSFRGFIKMSSTKYGAREKMKNSKNNYNTKMYENYK